jgi:hypothetical protein
MEKKRIVDEVRNPKPLESLDERTEKLLKEENPQAEAVSSLINVKKRQEGENSEVELKTDIPNEFVLNLHTSLDVVGNWLENTFHEKSILTELIHKRERKAISLKRQSRAEIVAVARSPDFNNTQMGVDEGVFRKFFTPRPK